MRECEFCKKSSCEFERKRCNKQDIVNDKAYAELAYYQHKYRALEKRFSIWSKITRRVATYSLPVLVLSLGCLIFEKYFNVVLPPCMSYFKELKPFLPMFSVLSLTSFSWAFFANRLSGYTRGWSRNRLMREHIERLIREYQLAIYNKDVTNEFDKEFIDSEQENILAKLFQLEETNRIQTHNDIVGDYFSAHDGAFGWIKGLKK
ncbi:MULTISPECIES: hypothetical protein [Vibrio]|uniref:hypothetical protein n=1 Tax=Vibrio TaxID=662 RepID=UPI0010BD5AA4|nr:hypothetical protein [Vibrio sp. F12]TKE77698.1 hypothetical protein FCV54_19075 [Vibrio sp. F12]